MNKHKNHTLPSCVPALKKLLKDIISKNDIRPYEGIDIETNRILACDLPIKDTFEKENLERYLGGYPIKDFKDVFILKVLQLGYSIGFETAYSEYLDKEDMFKELEEIIKKHVNEKKNITAKSI